MRETMRQRIAYLIEHGGVYPQDPPDRWRWVVTGMLVVILLVNLAMLMLLR